MTEETAAVVKAEAKPAKSWAEAALDPVMGYEMKLGGVTIEFDFERPHTYADFERFSVASALAFAEGESRLDGMRMALAAFITDTRGVPDFEARGADESVDEFRVRWERYWAPSSNALANMFMAFNNDAAPTVVRRPTFRA